MYNDTLKVANKIISDTDLADIFCKMWEGIEKYNRILKQETSQNQRYERQFQRWTTRDFMGTLKFSVNFYDDTKIDFDNYNNFMVVFNNRLHEIKDIYVRFSYSYSVRLGEGKDNYYNQSITMWIYEDKVEIDVSLSTEDRRMDEVYDLIKEKILKAPEKYDRVVRKKNLITNKINFALGVIPGVIISILLLLVPTIREIFAASYVLYPICSVVLGLMIGGTVFGGRIDNLYKNIVPEKKYVGYDSSKGAGIYKDDVDKFVETSEILIGKNVDNLKNRKEIEEMEKKYEKYIPFELGLILVLSIVVLFLE